MVAQASSHSRFQLVLVVAAAILLAAPTLSQAAVQDRAEPPKILLSVSGGVHLPGSVYVEPYNYDTEGGPRLALALDFVLARYLVVGLIGTYDETKIPKADVKAKVAGLGFSLKVPLGDPTSVHVRAGVNVQYQYSNIDVKDSDPANGLGIGVLGEIVVPVSAKMRLLGQGGFITQPVGGTGAIDVTWDPIVFLGGGLEFGF